ncbi:MAG: AAA family ATPase [Alphaproteobacteria bacterium]|nr:AAA family ATPase [Alphaproteobacteria bacterium]
MLKYLYLENFKGIRKKRFDFKQINILWGPNNSGKSSVLNALNLIAQTLLSDSPGVSLALNDRFDDLGTYQDLVFGHNPRTKMIIEFGITVGSNLLTFHYEFKYRSQRREIEINHFTLKRGAKELYAYSVKKDSYSIKYHGKSSERFKSILNKRLSPEFRGLKIFDRNLEQAILAFIQRKDAQKQLGAEDKKKANSLRLLMTVVNDLNTANYALDRTFSAFDSLGPFRERPKRTYQASGTSPETVGKMGTSAIDILVSDLSRRGKASNQFVDQTSAWFRKSGMAQEIKIKPLTSRHYEVCLIDAMSRAHNLCDVGFGCSQVLPVLVSLFTFADQAKTKRPPILIIQEPEIHLHPNAQAELGSLFARLSPSQGQLFIETHSPYLIIRMQTEIAKGKLSADAIKFYYAKNKRSSSNFYELTVGNDGMFEQKLPFGFFPQRYEETLNLARAASKVQQRKMDKEKND